MTSRDQLNIITTQCQHGLLEFLVVKNHSLNTEISFQRPLAVEIETVASKVTVSDVMSPLLEEVPGKGFPNYIL